MKIRKAVVGDIEFLKGSLEENRRIEERPEKDIQVTQEDVESFKKGIRQGSILVAEIDNNPVAFLYYRTDWDVMYVNERTFWIDLIFVKEEFRGRGIGRMLYDEAIKIAKELGFRRITIDVFEANGRSKRFHSRLGFKPVYTIYQKEI